METYFRKYKSNRFEDIAYVVAFISSIIVGISSAAFIGLASNLDRETLQFAITAASFVSFANIYLEKVHYRNIGRVLVIATSLRGILLTYFYISNNVTSLVILSLIATPVILTIMGHYKDSVLNMFKHNLNLRSFTSRSSVYRATGSLLSLPIVIYLLKDASDIDIVFCSNMSMIVLTFIYYKLLKNKATATE